MTLTNDQNLSSVLSIALGRSQVAAYVCHMHNGTKVPNPPTKKIFTVFVFEKLSTSFGSLQTRMAMKYNSTHYVGITMQSTQKKCQSNKSLAKHEEWSVCRGVPGTVTGRGVGFGSGSYFSAALTGQERPKKKQKKEEYIFRVFQARRNVNINSFNILRLCVFKGPE